MIYGLLAFIILSAVLGVRLMLMAVTQDRLDYTVKWQNNAIKGYKDLLHQYDAKIQAAPDDWFAQALAFHRKFNAPIQPFPRVPRPAESEMCIRLMEEEVLETVNAIEAGDLVEVADGLADIIYIALGTAVSYGIDLRPVFAEVHASNMRKEAWSPELAAQLEAIGKKIPMGKILKPIGWVGPQIAPILNEQGSLYSSLPDGSCVRVDNLDKVVIE